MPTPAPGLQDGVLTVSDLEARLPAFAAAIRRRGFSDSTVTSYLTGVRFFVRWLGGENLPPRPPVRNGPDRTRRVLEDLALRRDQRAIAEALEAHDRPFMLTPGPPPPRRSWGDCRMWRRRRIAPRS